MDNRRDLIKVGLSLFSQRGYEAVGVQEIVDAAEVTKPTLYHYFQSKRGLLDAILEEGYLPFWEAFDKVKIYQHDLVQTLTLLTKCYFAFSNESPVFFRFQVGLQLAPPESVSFAAVRPYAVRQMDAITLIFLQAENDHGNMKGRSFLYAASYIGMIHAHAINLVNNSVRADDQYTYRAVHQFMHGIFS